jgi:putative heme iron utilization protein
VSAAAERAAAARGLMRRARHATLATTRDDGWAYASLVTVACDADASPILLLSDLADHTGNLARDDRCSMLFEAASGLKNPQQGPRVTVMGRCRRSDDERCARRFLARHPRARLYAGFGDFHFYRLAVEDAHYVGGFAAAAWIRGRRILSARRAAAAIARAEPGILERMNRDRGRAVAAFATRILGRRGKAWRLIGVDPDGIDLRIHDSFARLDFETPVADAAALGRRLAVLARKAGA